jgi:flagellar biosynthetic protein FlhB
MDMSQNGDKTEKATPHKKQDERKKGNIFQSRDVVAAVSLLAMAYLIKLGGGWLKERMAEGIRSACESISATEQLSARDAAGVLAGFGLDAALMIVPIAGAAMLLSVLLVGVQTRFSITPSLLSPKLSRINPVTGFKNLFSPRTPVELLKSIIKVIIIAGVLYADLKGCLPTIALTPLVEPFESVRWLGTAVFDITVRIAMFMAVFAAFDYLYQWWDYEKRLRMTKEEVKEEYKRMEGDPNIKGKIRSIQRKLAAMRMMQKVPTAHVVIKNPTHYAVALRYSPPKDLSPVVVAKGADLLALRIIRVAEENGVYVTENKPLARGLYEAVDLDRPIPEEFYKPVAEIIAFLYNLKKRRPI